MRAIDADAIKYRPIPHVALFGDVKTKQDTVTRGEIDEMPTVEAIPVEWIERFGKENFYDWDTEFNAISVMLDAWRKEGKNEKS